MTDAIAAGNFDKAAEVLGELLHMQEAPIKLLAVLGKITDTAMQWLERRLLAWRDTYDNTGGRG